MEKKVKEDKNFIKNTDNNAILCNDVTSLKKYKEKRNNKKNIEDKIKQMEIDINNLKAIVAEILGNLKNGD